jgi:hypothetical protein
MSGRDAPRLDDRDDWFVDPGEPQGPDDWLEPEPAERPARGFIPRSRPGRRTVLIAAGAVLVLLLVGLAIGGVFSGSKHPATTPTTAPSTTTQPSTTKTQAPSTRNVPSAPTTTLKPGDQGAQVTKLQRALTRLGYSPGAADGDYGPSTQAALERFQRAQKLTADGILGPRTLSALKQALRSNG